MFSYEKLKNKAILFLLIALVPNIILTFFLLAACNPRYLISLIPFISLLFVLGLSWFKKYSYLGFCILLVLLLVITFPMAKEIHTVPSPGTQAVTYILDNYENLNNTIVYRDFILEGYFEINGIEAPYYNNSNLKNSFYKNITILFIREGQKPPVSKGNLTLVKEFKRDIGIAPKIWDVCLYKLNADSINSSSF